MLARGKFVWFIFMFAFCVLHFSQDQLVIVYKNVDVFLSLLDKVRLLSLALLKMKGDVVSFVSLFKSLFELHFNVAICSRW